ncbi:MAG: nucleoside deaminase [Actinobacteria bacterium]|nr:nucleoside deaminase [Actinomycetota bacterium]
MCADNETRVARMIERLSNTDLRAFEAEVRAKRLAWLDANLPHQSPDALGGIDAGLLVTGSTIPATAAPVTPRQAYELLFRKYMGLNLAELPVVSESEKEITWLSRNACPTLEACASLGLDTRVVCRAVYEKSTQAFLSRLDPRLRFIRDYNEIRPHAPHCREQIVSVDFAAMMEMALEEARVSRSEGNKGYGAVVSLGERVLACEHDTATSEGDPSLHAEFKALRRAVRVLGSPNLSGGILFSTCEPCPMCTGLAVWTNVTAVCFGASIADTADMGKSRILVSTTHIAERSPCFIEVFGGCLKDECESLYR